jgi:hypothetical protein
MATKQLVTSAADAAAMLTSMRSYLTANRDGAMAQADRCKAEIAAGTNAPQWDGHYWVGFYDGLAEGYRTALREVDQYATTS